MKETSSYVISNIAYNVDKEIDRLKGQVDLFWDKEFLRYKQFGLKNKMSLVEFGSGPGFLTEKLLDSFTQLNITCVEIDELLVKFAKNHLRKQKKKCKIIEGSILNSSLPENSFDFAIVRLLIEHLPDPIDAIKEVYRILKPGGVAVFVDNDFEMHIRSYPHIPQLKNLYDAYCKKREDEGGHPLIGRYLPVLLNKAMFKSIDYEIICAHSSLIGDEPFSRSEGVGIPMKLVQDGYLDSKYLANLSINWRNMMKSEDHLMLRQLSMCSGIK